MVPIMNKLEKHEIMKMLKGISGNDPRPSKDETIEANRYENNSKAPSSSSQNDEEMTKATNLEKHELYDNKEPKKEAAAKTDNKDKSAKKSDPQSEIKEVFEHERETMPSEAVKDTVKDFAKGLGADMAIAAMTAAPNPAVKIIGAGLGIAKGINDKTNEREAIINAAEAQALKEAKKKAKKAMKATQHEKHGKK